MICKLTKKKTSKIFRNIPISNDVLYFAKWYRDKLNVQQRQKINIAINRENINKKNVFVDTASCLNTFFKMKEKSYSWTKIKETLIDELMLKGLLNDEEYNEKINEISKTEE